MLIIGISAFFALLVFSPYIAGVLRETAGTTFAGAVHYSLDYYYYLSYMAQGKLRWLTSLNINTQDVHPAVFYHWLYVLSGRVFAILGISNIIGYQLLVLGLTILLLFVSYRLIRAVIPSRAGRTIAYILFLVSNAWPYLTRTATGWTFGYYQSWYNYGEPFTRFSSIPHNLLAQSVLIAALLFLVCVPHMFQSRSLFAWVLFLMSGFLLASTQTPLVLIVVLTYGIFWVRDVVSSRDPKKYLHAALCSSTFPPLILFVSGAVPYMAYLHTLFQNPPYNFTSWEVSLQIHLTFLQFLQINGPVMLLGLVGLPVLLSTRTKIRQIIVVSTLVSWGIFLSPIPMYISILNVRFLSVVPTLTMACSAAILIEAICKRVNASMKMLLRIGIILLILGLTFPATVQQIIARSTLDPFNAYLFLPDTVMDAYKHVENLIKPQETCLVVWPFNISFAGLTGRRAFIANGFSTINYQAKEQQQNAFFSGQTPMDQKKRILSSNGISCVVTYTFTTGLPSALSPIYANSYMTIYRVEK
ncbi:MAG: hypothetical protein NT149_04515 [Candidatus Gottesmanbacteria bacterium]|nr:hypothetical protein [Candidatus Gottesmanbacteria bacterium]